MILKAMSDGYADGSRVVWHKLGHGPNHQLRDQWMRGGSFFWIYEDEVSTCQTVDQQLQRQLLCM